VNKGIIFNKISIFKNTNRLFQQNSLFKISKVKASGLKLHPFLIITQHHLDFIIATIAILNG